MELQPNEILENIFGQLSYQEFGRLRQCCRRFNVFIPADLHCSEIDRSRRQRIADLRRYNPLWELIKNTPQQNIDWTIISSSKYIYWDLIKSNLDLPWVWIEIIRNPNITYNWDPIHMAQHLDKLIYQHVDIDKQFVYICAPYVTIDIVINNLQLRWDWSVLSCNPNIASAENISKYLDWPWDWFAMSEHVSCELFMQYIDKPWNWNVISARSFANIEFVEQHIRSPWNWSILTANPSIYWDDIISRPNRPWKHWHFSKNPNITEKIMRDYPTISWSTYQMSSNPGISLRLIKSSGHIFHWNLFELSSNPAINIDIIRYLMVENLWSWRELSANPAIKYNDIMNNLDMPWDLNGLLLNPNLDPHNVLEYFRKIAANDALIPAQNTNEQTLITINTPSASNTPKKSNSIIRKIINLFKH